MYIYIISAIFRSIKLKNALDIKLAFGIFRLLVINQCEKIAIKFIWFRIALNCLNKSRGRVVV